MANISIADLTPTSLETLTIYDMSDNFVGILDELQNATISNTEETEDRTGRNGRVISVLRRNKAASVTATNGLLNLGVMQAQTGGKIQSGSAPKILITDNLFVGADHSVILTSKSEVTALEAVYVKTLDMAGATLEDKSLEESAPAGGYKYESATKKVSFNAEVPENTEVVVQYFATVENSVWLTNPTDTFSMNAKLYVDALAEDRCGKTYHVQYYFPKTAISGNFDIEFGDNQSVHNFEARALAGGCGNASNDFWTATIFGVDDKGE